MGRPSKLTEELTAKIADSVRKGVSPEVATLAEGVSHGSFYDWRKRGIAGEEPFAAFWTSITRAVAESEVALVQKVAAGDGQAMSFGEAKASLELLQRRFPKRWSVQFKVEMTDQLNRYLDVAQRILDPETFTKLLTELAAEDEDPRGDAPEAPAADPMH